MGLFHRFRREAVQLCCCNRLDFAFGGERRDLVEDSPVGFGGVVVRQPAENHFRAGTVADRETARRVGLGVERG